MNSSQISSISNTSMTDFVEYKRPFIVLLIFVSILFLATNFGGHIFSYENFIDQPYTCNKSAADRMACINAGGHWKEDGAMPAGCDPACTCCTPNASFPLSINYPQGSCPESNEVYTITDVTTMYTVTQSALPSGTPARDANGMMTAEALKTHLDELAKRGAAATPPPVSAKPKEVYEYLKADETALNAMQAEYCYYAARYRYCIMKIIETAGGSAVATVDGGSASAIAQPVLADWLTAARTLNTRLMDLVTIMKGMTTARMAMGPQMGVDVAKLNADLSVRMQKLSEQSGDLASNNNAVYKKMVEYTKQKAKANANLVLLYTFMNLIALGMLFYVYRAS
jgi:hypothetical protein